MYLCSCTRAHASLDMQSCSLVLSNPPPAQHLAKSCSPFGGVSTPIRCKGSNMSSVTAFSFPCYKQSPERLGKSEDKLSFAKLAFMSFLFPELLGLGARLEMDVALILSRLSLPLTHFYPNPCLSLLNHLTLFAYLHLPAHCYSLLPATPFLARYIMFMWYAFHSFISVIRYRLPIPLLLSHGAKIACVTLHCLPLCHLSAISKKNQLSIK